MRIIVHYFSIGLVASIGTTIAGDLVRDFADLYRIKPMALTWLLSAAITDILITTVLLWFLVREPYSFKAWTRD